MFMYRRKGGIIIDNKYLGTKFEINKSFSVSEDFFNKLEKSLDNASIDGYYGVFNNCREQGLVLKLYTNYNELNIWTCECRNTDDVMVIVADNTCIDEKNMFDEKAYKAVKYYKDIESAVESTYRILKKNFAISFNTTTEIIFNTNKSIHDIQRISMDAKDLDYEDYHDLATLYNKTDGYAVDLIILDGEFGLRYSKVDNEEYENITFEKTDLDLTNETTLMLGMQQKLREFVDTELDYNYEFNSGIKI